MTEDVRQFIKSVINVLLGSCREDRIKPHLANTWWGKPMFERVGVDILGSFPITTSGNCYALVISDCFTKWTECVAIPDQEAKTTEQTFINHFVCRFGAPLQLHSDQGECFENNVFQEVFSSRHGKKSKDLIVPLPPCLLCTAQITRPTGICICHKS